MFHAARFDLTENLEKFLVFKVNFMYVPQDSMWREILKSFWFLGWTKQDLPLKKRVKNNWPQWSRTHEAHRPPMR